MVSNAKTAIVWPSGLLQTLSFAIVLIAAPSAYAVTHATPTGTSDYGKLPLAFEVNQGQTGEQVLFVSHGSGYNIFLTGNAAVLNLTHPQSDSLHRSGSAFPVQNSRAAPINDSKAIALRMQLAGSQQAAKRVQGEDPLPGVANYLIGNDPAKWRTNVPTYAKVRYTDVYPGIDMVYYGNQRKLEYDFVVSAGANPRLIELQFMGATRLKLTKEGGLDIQTGGGQIAFDKPLVYQMKNGKRETVSGGFHLLAGNRLTFNLGDYDHARALVIDPVLVYSTFLGGTGGDAATAVAIDSSGDAYITGDTGSTDFPITGGAFERKLLSGSGFISKLNPTGTALIYSTFLGGSTGLSSMNAIAVDSIGEAFVAGYTYDTDFPITPGSYQQTNNTNGNYTGFVTKLNSTGTGLVYSTYLGGSYATNPDFGLPWDSINGIGVDGSGSAYVTGASSSEDFPGGNPSYSYGTFVTKLNPAGSELAYSTFIAGNGSFGDSFIGGDQGNAIAVDPSGNAYVAGYAYSPNIPVTEGAFQTVNNADKNYLYYQYFQPNGFVSKLGSDGSLIYSTYLGGSNPDAIWAVAFDQAGDAYVTGTATSLDFPVTKGAFQRKNKTASKTGSSTTAFVTELNPEGTALIYSTYLGGTTQGWGSGIGVDELHTAYVVGSTTSRDFPTTAEAFQATNRANHTGNPNAFVTRLNPSGTALIYSTYLGGTNSDYASGIAVDANGNAYITGVAQSPNFPATHGAFEPVHKSRYGTGFVSKLAIGVPATETRLVSDTNPATRGLKVTFTANVTASSGTDIPAGTVTFTIDNGFPTEKSVDDTGHAAFTTNALADGKHTIDAFYSGSTLYSPSFATLAEYIDEPQAATPTASPAAGAYSSTQTVRLADTTHSFTIYYTVDGTTPTKSSTRYTAPIQVSQSETIKAIAVADTFKTSEVLTAIYTIK